MEPVFNKLLLTPYKEPIYDILLLHTRSSKIINKIHDSKLVHGKPRYLVEWFGYPERHEWTWEPPSNVKNAPLKVKEFYRNHPSAPHPVKLKEFTFISIYNFNELQSLKKLSQCLTIL